MMNLKYKRENKLSLAVFSHKEESISEPMRVQERLRLRLGECAMEPRKGTILRSLHFEREENGCRMPGMQTVSKKDTRLPVECSFLEQMANENSGCLN